MKFEEWEKEHACETLKGKNQGQEITGNISNLDRLLRLEGHHLEVWKFYDGGIGVSYQNADVKEGGFLIGTYGCGKTFEEACDDYMHKISGKVLVFGMGESAERITVL